MMSATVASPGVVQELLPQASSAPIWLVGGWVRDHVLQRETHDYDLVVDGDALAIARRMADAMAGDMYTLDESRNIGRVLFHWHHMPITLDIAKLQSPTIDEDLQRRDFSINALAVDLRTGRLLDPTGGLQDIRDRRLRIHNPDAFQEDPIRLLRAVRFAVQLGFRWSNETLAGLRVARPLLASVSPERIRDELFHILALHSACIALRLMAYEGLVEAVLPGLDDRDAAMDSSRSVVAARMCQLLNWLEVPRRDPAGSLLEAELLQLIGNRRTALADVLKRCNPSGRSVRDRLLLTAYVMGDADVHHPSSFRRLRQQASSIARHLRLSRVETVEIDQIITLVPAFDTFLEVKVEREQAAYRLCEQGGDALWMAFLLYLSRGMSGEDGVPNPQPDRLFFDSAASLLEEVLDRCEAFHVKPLLDGKDIQQLLDISAGREVGLLLHSLKQAQALGKIVSLEDARTYIKGLWKEHTTR